MQHHTVPRRHDVVVVGGGPIGIHVLSRLVEDGVVDAGAAALVDPHDEVFAQWNTRAGNCRMPFLRSPASHGIDPDFRAIRRLASGEDQFTPPYHRPSVQLFRAHLENRWTSIADSVDRRRGTVSAIDRDGDDWVVTVSGGDSRDTLRTAAVVLAPGQPPPRMPVALSDMPVTAPVYHTHRDLLPEFAPGDRVAIVGGGIAAAHLATTLPERHVIVDLWNRDRFTTWQFDSSPCFVGPRCGTLFREIADPWHRRDLIARSRRPGSVPADLNDALVRHRRNGQLRVISVELDAAAAAGRGVLLRGRSVAARGARRPLAREYDAVIACTGFEPGPPAAELIAALAAHSGLALAPDGYPVPRHDLSWAPGLFLAGALAELEVGPPARNLVGAHLAGRRIVPGVARHLGAERDARVTRARRPDGYVAPPGSQP